jgi:hypothetical protein
MRNVFNTFDVDGDGSVQAQEVGNLLRSLNLVTSRKMIRCIVEVVDTDGDGAVPFVAVGWKLVVGHLGSADLTPRDRTGRLDRLR